MIITASQTSTVGEVTHSRDIHLEVEEPVTDSEWARVQQALVNFWTLTSSPASATVPETEVPHVRNGQ